MKGFTLFSKYDEDTDRFLIVREDDSGDQRTLMVYECVHDSIRQLPRVAIAEAKRARRQIHSGKIVYCAVTRVRVEPINDFYEQLGPFEPELMPGWRDVNQIAMEYEPHEDVSRNVSYGAQLHIEYVHQLRKWAISRTRDRELTDQFADGADRIRFCDSREDAISALAELVQEEIQSAADQHIRLEPVGVKLVDTTPEPELCDDDDDFMKSIPTLDVSH